MVIDTHAHLQDEIYTDRQRILNEMPNDNMEKIVCASADFETSKKALELAKTEKNIYCMIGLHPDYANQFSNDFKDWLLENGENSKVVAIGEIGLDYHTEGYDKDKQKQVFIEQLKIANKLNLPVVIHVRDAYQDVLEVFNENKNLITNGGIIHCYSGSYEVANQFIQMGFLIAFGGVLTFKNAKKSVEVASKLDVKNLVVETDCPWLCPEPHRGERNEPKYVNFVVKKLAEIKNIEIKNLEKILLENSYQVFSKMKRN